MSGPIRTADLKSRVQDRTSSISLVRTRRSGSLRLASDCPLARIKFNGRGLRHQQRSPSWHEQLFLWFPFKNRPRINAGSIPVAKRVNGFPGKLLLKDWVLGRRTHHCPALVVYGDDRDV